MVQTRPIQLHLYCTRRRIVESNDQICIEHLRAFSPWTMMMNLNFNMNSNLTHMSRVWYASVYWTWSQLYKILPGDTWDRIHSCQHLKKKSRNDLRCAGHTAHGLVSSFCELFAKLIVATISDLS